MHINIGTPERRARLVLGVVLLLLPLLVTLPGFWSWLAAIAGLVLILTAVLRFCPAWAIFGINTARRDRR